MDVDDMTVVLSNGATLTGTITFLPGQTNVPDPTQVRITAPSTDQSAFGGPQPNARVDKDGHFTLAGVPAGPHLIRANGNMRGWSLKSVTIDGRDVTDTPIELRSAQNLANVAIVFTDKLSEINGNVTDQQDVPVPDFTVLAFSTDPRFWRPQSRQIMTARPDQTGQYRIRGLPPGDYYVATVDPAEQGEWFEPAYLDEHRIGAARLTLGDGDVKTKDFKGAEIGAAQTQFRPQRFQTSDFSFRLRGLSAHRSPQRNCRTLIAATGTASARSVRWPSVTRRTPRARAADHSASVHPPSGPIRSDASAGTVWLRTDDSGSASTAAAGSTSIRRSAAAGSSSNVSSVSGMRISGTTARRDCFTDASATRRHRSTAPAADERGDGRLGPLRHDRLNRGDAQHHGVADDVVHLVRLEHGLHERQRRPPAPPPARRATS